MIFQEILRCAQNDRGGAEILRCAQNDKRGVERQRGRWEEREKGVSAAQGKFIFGLVSEDANPDDALGMKRLRGHKGAAISRIVTICAGEIGIKGRLTMETARKSFALRALQSGLPLPALSRILGHGSTGSTVAYLGLDDRFTESEVLKIYNH